MDLMVIDGDERDLHSGKYTKSYGTSPFRMGTSTINGPFSNSYVKLQEGIRGYLYYLELRMIRFIHI